MIDWLTGKKKLPPWCLDNMNDFNNMKIQMDRDEIDTLLQENNIDIKGKRVLDVGMGRGHHFVYLYELGADVYGCDGINYFDYAEYLEYLKDKIFFKTVENLPEELLGTFDIVIQYRYQADSPDAIRTIAKALKPNGKYIVTSYDEHLGYIDCFGNHNITNPSKELQTLQEVFGELEFSKPLFAPNGDSVQCIASKPRIIEKKTKQDERKKFIATLQELEPTSSEVQSGQTEKTEKIDIIDKELQL